MEAKQTVGRPKARPRIRDRVVAEVVETLMETAGAAHQDVVIQRIASRRGEPATDHLAQEVVGRFEAHLKARSRQGSPLLRKAFGEGSRRWMLEPQAYALFER